LVLLHSYRHAVATLGDQRLADVVASVYQRAATVLPSIRRVAPAEAAAAVERVRGLVRVALGFEAIALDRALLADRLTEVAVDAEATPMVRGAALGVLYTLGVVGASVLARELEGIARGGPAAAATLGPLLDGLFVTARGAVQRSERLLAAVHGALLSLDDEVFVSLLPDLRRAFTHFAPTEIDRMAHSVVRLMADDSQEERHAAPSAEAVATGEALDERVQALFQRALSEGSTALSP
jgi:hypothetical protein